MTDDPVLAPRDATIWEHRTHEGGPCFAVTSWTFLTWHVEQAPVCLDDVPFELLALALRES